MSVDSKIGEEITITWRIENFSFYDLNVLEVTCIDSPSFGVENFNGSMCLQFYPRGCCKSDRYISCNLCVTDEQDKMKISNHKIDIIADGEILKSKIMKSQKTRPIYFHAHYSHSNNFMKIVDFTKKMENCKEDTLIFRCYLTVDKTKQKRTATNYEMKTRIVFDRCSFESSVADFNSQHWKECKTFQFKLYFIEIYLTAPEDALLIEIRKREVNSTDPRIAICRVSLCDIEGIERHSRKYTHVFDNNDKDDITVWQFPSFITKTQMNTFLKDGALSLMCELSIFNGTIESEVLNKSSPLNVFSPTDTFGSLKEDLRSMLTSKKYSDVKLQVDGEIFPAHKNLLAARSPVFSAMFDQDMLENQTGVVDMPDMDAETLNSFLSFMYTGTVDKMDYEVALKLLLAADKYQVELLKEKCASFLKSKLSDGNVCEVLVVADMVGHNILKESAQDYIKAHARRILISQEWSQCVEKNVRLASEIFSKLSLHFGSLADEESDSDEEE